ncbi:MAG: carboxypeptidase-like regulatory domain-containing protein, partial [Bacteroides sp.]|nr:carboxypeptidase-like regulatory domain-containing protein [Bacteroides sp.]
MKAKEITLAVLLWMTGIIVQAADIKGVVTDRSTHEPLIGASILIKGTTNGTITDFDGRFELTGLRKGSYTLVISYVAFKTAEVTVQVPSDTPEVAVALEPDNQQLSEVTVTARKNLEGERALQMERQRATVAIENMGAKEMSAKGISNVQEGVKKLSGISIASAGQLIVRGLGDRYSTTTLNGLAIASPNPDNKLIPLDLFPSSTVQNITVSKVYEAGSFADYSGAHIDITTKEHITEDFFSIGLNTGGAFNTIGKDRYQMDRNGSLFRTPDMDKATLDMPLTDFDRYVTTKNIFDTSFDVEKKTALPALGGNISLGKNFGIGNQTLSVLASVNVSNDYQNIEDAYYKTLEATGNVQSDFGYDSYAQELKLAALGYVGYTLRQQDRLGYTFFYARNATDTYQRREGEDAEGHQLIGSNNVTHIYTLQNHQLSGQHYFGGSQWELDWGASYGKTGSEEPDRRQVMYIKDEINPQDLSLFKLNRQETMRYFGNLNEEEWNARLSLKWKWSENNSVRLGFNYKDKDRDYMGTRFYYNLNKLNPTIGSIYETSGFLNQENVADGTLVIERKKQPKDSYLAGNE